MEERNEIRLPHKTLVFGVFFILLGTAMLLYTNGILPNIWDFWPLMTLGFGLILLYFVFAKGAVDLYLFPGFLFSLVGLMFLIIKVLPPSVELKRIWPVFMTNTGIALWLYGYALKKERRYSIFIPAWSIILLSFVFIVFSLDIIKMSFLTFIRTWWPLIFLIFGSFLVIENILHRKK